MIAVGHVVPASPPGWEHMDTYADSAGVVQELNLKEATMSPFHRRREVAADIAPHGTNNVQAGLVLIGACRRWMLKTARNPAGLPIEVFESTLGRSCRRSQFFNDLRRPCYGTTDRR